MRFPRHIGIDYSGAQTPESRILDKMVGVGIHGTTKAAKILTGFEALIRLGFITWSASFIFLEMQRYWREDNQGKNSKKRTNHQRE